MSTIFKKSFFKQIVERAVKTLAQAAAALLVANGTGLLDTDWLGILSVSGMAAIVSVLTSVGSGYIGDDSPSLVEDYDYVPEHGKG